MVKINKAEIMGTLVGVLGLGTLAITAPIAYYGEKFYEDNDKKAREPNGIISRYWAAYNNKEGALGMYISCTSKKELKLDCSYLQRDYQAAKYILTQLDKERAAYQQEQEKFYSWSKVGNFFFPGIFFCLVGGVIFLEGAAIRKKEESCERRKLEKVDYQNCSSLDEAFYCSKIEQSHLDAARINNFLK